MESLILTEEWMQVGYGEGRKSESQGGSRKWDGYVELEKNFLNMY